MRDANTSPSYILLCSQKTIKVITYLYQNNNNNNNNNNNKGGKEGEGEEEGGGRSKRTLNIREQHLNEPKEAKTS